MQGRTPCEDWSYPVRRKGTPNIDRNHQKLRERHETIFFTTSEETNPANTFASDFSLAVL